MIPNTDPAIHAVIETQTEGKADVQTRPVVAWATDGVALVPDGQGLLVRAPGLPGFMHLGNTNSTSQHGPRIIQIMPADGWRVRYLSENDADSEEPLMGWGLQTDGEVIPLSADAYGYVKPLHDVTAVQWELRTPEGIIPDRPHGVNA